MVGNGVGQASMAIDQMGRERTPSGIARQRAMGAAMTVAGLALGCGLTVAGMLQVDRLPWGEAATALRVATWPTAEATVTIARLDEVAIPARGGAVPELRLRVAYDYEVRGQRFDGTRASPADRARADDRRIVAIYRRAEFARITGKPIEISYDPARPNQAYIEALMPWNRMLPGLCKGAALVLLAGWCFSLALPGQRNARRLSRRK